MLAEPKPFVPPFYPPRPYLPIEEQLKIYLKTRDFYDLPDSEETDAHLYRDAHEPERLVFYKRDMRLVIFTSDIETVIGCSDRTARRMLQEVRDTLGLPKGAPVTIKDFCEKCPFPYDVMHEFIMES
ncbi:MAG TPA: hypothetical protein VIM79_24575 [Niastella sp.]